MGAPFTQVEIQAEIDFYKEQMRVATQGQEKSYDQGPTGQFGIKKGNLEEIRESLQYWIDLMDKYYPDAYETAPNIELNEIGYLNG
jgi:hypothetical protein